MDLGGKTIALIGLGYVGLPLAVEFGKVRTASGQKLTAAEFLQARALGTQVQVTVLHPSADTARAAMADALAQVQAVDRLMSLHRADSQVAVLNRDGHVDAPDTRLLQVLAQAQALSQQTGGAFDVTVQPLWQLYTEAQSRGTLPTPAQVAAARQRVDWRALQLSPARVALQRPGMAVTLNGLAQGYAADLALQALHKHGITQPMLDTGEFTTLGDKADGQPWRLGIRHPRQADTRSPTLLARAWLLQPKSRRSHHAGLSSRPTSR